MVEQRPRWHITAPAGWLNDANGPIQWRGTYHLFYQHNPNGPAWGDIHWAHVASRDLAHWRQQPLALTPTPGGPDAGGCWSGCAVDDQGAPTLMYTGVRPKPGGGWQEAQCLAVGSDDLMTWRKHPANPVIAAPPEGLDVVGFRDPCVWREGDAWYCILGTGIRGVGGAILLYRSPDLVHWEYRGRPLTGDLNAREPLWTGPMWECPQFFPLGDRHVLIISIDAPPPHRCVAAYVGTFDGAVFTPESLQRFDCGDNYYAPITMRDDQGRRLCWGWSTEARSAAAQAADGWSGVLTLPRVLTLGPDHRLRFAPAPELTALRGRPIDLADVPLAPGQPWRPTGVAGDSLELALDVALETATTLMLDVRAAPGGEEATVIRYDRAAATLSIDRERASVDPAVARGSAAGPLALAPDEPLRLRVFLDRSIVEVFASERLCLTERVYPTRPDSLGIALRAAGGAARLTRFAAWELGSGVGASA